MSKDDNSQPQKGNSLHGSNAAKRQAITELLFFSSVGDLQRSKIIVDTWSINVADPACCDYDKRSPLHLASAEGAYSLVEWLLTLGADINFVDRFKRTPLEEAVRGDHGEIASLLISKGAQVVGDNGELIDLAQSRLAGNVRLFDSEFNPEWEIDQSQLVIQDKIGEGEFGVVHRALWHGTVVAVKILKNVDHVALGDFKTELNVLQKVHHPHCVQFLGGSTQTPYMIVTELMQGGSLADVFKSPDKVTLRRGVEMALNCARGLAYLHNRQTQQVIHRDLKPANLMIGGNARGRNGRKTLVHETGVVKLADFGLSKSLSLGRTGGANGQANGTDHERFKLTGETGSYRYMAPEVFRHEPYNHKVDVYAFSMICYQLFEGLAPFFNLHPVDAARKVSTLHIRPEWGANSENRAVPEDLRKLVEQCWHKDHEQRPSFPEVIPKLEAILESLPASQPAACGGCSIS